MTERILVKQMNIMKKVFYGFLLMIGCCHGSAQIKSLPAFFSEANEFLKSNVKNGRVDYKAIKNNPASLNNLVAFTAQKQSFGAAVNEKAFYINAYNVMVIKGIIDAYPVKGPMAINGFFDKIKYNVNGEKVTLNNIENDILRKKFPDARLHFALVCGAVSCPPIPSYAITPDKIDAQLTALTTESIRNSNFTKVDIKNKKVNVSMIFNWYKNDFIAANGSVLNFLNKYMETPLPAQTAVSFYDYDWSLNGK